MTPARLTDVTESDGCNGSKGKRLFPFLAVSSVAFCFSLLLFILAVPVFCQVPGVINYQGSLRDKSGNPINQSLPMTFSIYDTPATGTGTQLWTENQTVGVNNGVFSVHVGAVNPIPESVFASSSAYLEVDINGEAPSARPQLLSSPYSFHSSAADYALTVSSSIAVSTINATASTPFGGVNITTNAFIQGNVGIGTTNPQASLDIESGLLHVSGSPSPATPAQGAWIGWNALTGQPGETDFINNEGLGGGGFAFINTSSAGVHLSTPMFIAGSGNVGIGTTNPQSPLTIFGDTNWGVAEVIGNGTNAETTIGFRPSNVAKGTAGDWLIGTNVAGRNIGGLEIFGAASAGDILDITPGGNVGIGATSPTATFQVGTSGGGQTTLANSWGTFSSRRWKKDIQPIPDALEKVENLQGVEFRWKKSGKKDIGMIAEDVGKVFPQIVTYEKNGKDAKGFDYSKLVAPLIEAVKEQQTEIEKLKEEVQELKTR